MPPYVEITDNGDTFLMDPQTGAPQEVLDLMYAIEKALDTLKVLYLDKLQDKTTYQQFKNQLLLIANLGLPNNTSNPKAATEALDVFKNSIVQKEAAKMKNAYLLSLGKSALSLGLMPFLVGIAFDFIFYLVKMYPTPFNGHYANLNNLISILKDCLGLRNLLFIWSGSMVGVWLSFIISNVTITFDDLTDLEKDLLSPRVRLMFVGLLAIIFGLLFFEDAITIKIGTFSSTGFKNDGAASFLIGCVLGLNDKLLGSSISKKVSGLF